MKLEDFPRFSSSSGPNMVAMGKKYIHVDLRACDPKPEPYTNTYYLHNQRQT